MAAAARRVTYEIIDAIERRTAIPRGLRDVDQLSLGDRITVLLRSRSLLLIEQEDEWALLIHMPMFRFIFPRFVEFDARARLNFGWSGIKPATGFELEGTEYEAFLPRWSVTLRAAKIFRWVVETCANAMQQGWHHKVYTHYMFGDAVLPIERRVPVVKEVKRAWSAEISVLIEVLRWESIYATGTAEIVAGAAQNIRVLRRRLNDLDSLTPTSDDIGLLLRASLVPASSRRAPEEE